MKRFLLIITCILLPLAATANDDDTYPAPDCDSVYGFLDNCDLHIEGALEKCEAGDPIYGESGDLFYCMSNVIEQSGTCDMAAGCLEYADLPDDEDDDVADLDDDNDDNNDNNDDNACGCTVAPSSPAGPVAGVMMLVGAIALGGAWLHRRRYRG